MSNYTEVIAIVEGKTERNFIQLLIAPYLSQKGIYVTPILCNKRGSKGGDVKFSRLVHDIHRYLKQRSNTIITTCLDLYGLKEWPQKQEILKEPNHDQMIHKLVLLQMLH